jgi:thioester reductase-like protein
MKDFILSTQEIYNRYAKTWEKPVLSVKPAPSVRNVMITGSGGFLALHLIELLTEISSIEKIICVVRNRERFNANKQYYQLDFCEEKLVFIDKDILALEKEDLAQVDSVIHAAAKIHALKNLKQLYRDNVEASFHLYNLVNEVQASLMIISTLSVFVSSNQYGYHEEKIETPSDSHLLYGGYAQSKWLTEYCTPQCPVTVVRLGLLTGHDTRAIFPSGDFFSTMVKNLAHIKIPENIPDAQVDVTPVNLAAQKIVSLLLKCETVKEKEKHIVHIANEQHVTLKDIVQCLGIQPHASMDEFRHSLHQLSRLEQLLMLFALDKENSMISYPDYYNVDLFQATNHYWSGENMISCENNQAVLQRYCQRITTSN